MRKRILNLRIAFDTRHVRASSQCLGDLGHGAGAIGDNDDALARLNENYLRCGIRERDDTAYMRTVQPDFVKRRPRW